MEEFVGQLWHRWISRAAATQHPEAAVQLNDIARALGIYFRALGGDPALHLSPASQISHRGWRPWKQRLAGSGERLAQASMDPAHLRLPPCIDLFPCPQLNRDLYLWLTALASQAQSIAAPWFQRNQRATHAALALFPGLQPRYDALVSAHLANRPLPEQLADDEAAQERAIRQALHAPGSVDHLPPLTSLKSRPPLPVPLWLVLGQAAAGDGPQSQSGTTADPGSQATPADALAHKAERVTPPDAKAPLVMSFRAESLPTWAEYIRINRACDEDDDPNAKTAAADLDRLSLMRDGQTSRSRVRFHLDLPAAAEDDLPLGPGLRLPEWDYRQHRLQPEHCCLQPMLADQAGVAPLPSHLTATARRLRQQFAALRPARQWRCGQPEGSEPDIDRYVRNLADLRHGEARQLAAYLDPVRQARDLACLLLADLSMSTDAAINDHQRIIDVIRDTLFLFAEALSASGDTFGIYGFSSLRRDHVRFHILKDFAAAYDAGTRGRIAAIRPGFYTRMGAAIRQSSQILAEQAASRRLLLILTDGKPNDLDIYDSRYGLEDTRMAVIEARRAGLLPFCVTIDRDAAGYLPRIFGRNGFCLIRKPEELPQALPQLISQLGHS